MRLLLALSATLCLSAGCTGVIGGQGPAPAGGGGVAGDPSALGWQPVTPCDPVLPTRVTRLQDRQLANAIRDLLGAAARAHIQTTSGGGQDFLSAKAAAVTGAVAL